MGHRLSKIYTKTGDDGTTGLGDGSRVAKDHLRVEAFGTIDELNCLVGLLISQSDLPENIVTTLQHIQHNLFNLGGELCAPNTYIIEASDSEQLEKKLDTLNSNLPYLKDFILPGGSMAASMCHLARAVCRRAERRMISLHQQELLSKHSLAYVNRLSDLLFVIARVLARKDGREEILWQHKKP
jgi:cob(I)alamin adenosyltransferase